MLSGSVALSLWGHIEQKGRFLLRVIWVGSVAWFLFSFVHQYLVGLAMIFVFGMVAASFNTLCLTLLQSLVPDQMRGRVMGVYSLAYLGGGLLGNILAGFLTDHAGLAFASYLPAVSISAFALGIWLLRPDFQRLT